MGFFSPGQRLLLHSFGQVLLLYFIPRPAPPRPRLLWRSLSLLSFSLPLLTPPEACVTALPISGFEPQRLPKPPDCLRQIFCPGRREGSRGVLALYPSPSLHSLHLAVNQVFLPTGFIERTQSLTWKEKEGVAGDLLREKALGFAQLPTKISPWDHLPRTTRRPFIRVPKRRSGLRFQMSPAAADATHTNQEKPTTQWKDGQMK